MATNYPSPRIRHSRAVEGVRWQRAKRTKRKEALTAHERHYVYLHNEYDT